MTDDWISKELNVEYITINNESKIWHGTQLEFNEYFINNTDIAEYRVFRDGKLMCSGKNDNNHVHLAFKKKYTYFNERTDEILETVFLKSVEHNLAGEISYGQQKLLTIGCCLANDADILLPDEPVAGIDKDNYQRIFKLIQKLNSIENWWYSGFRSWAWPKEDNVRKRIG